MWDPARFSVCHVSASLHNLGTKPASHSVVCQTQTLSSLLHRGAVGSEHQRLRRSPSEGKDCGQHERGQRCFSRMQRAEFPAAALPG